MTENQMADLCIVKVRVPRDIVREPDPGLSAQAERVQHARALVSQVAEVGVPLGLARFVQQAQKALACSKMYIDRKARTFNITIEKNACAGSVSEQLVAKG